MRKIYTAIALALTLSATAWAQNPSARYSVPQSVEKAETTLPSVSEMITQQPAGTLYQNMSRSCEGFDYGYQKTYDAYAGDIVVSADGKKIYMKNPMLCMQTGWIVGDLDAEGNVEFKFPQVIYDQSQDASGTAYALTGYAWKMINDTEKKAFTLDANSQTVKFKWTDGKLTQVNPDDVIGMGNGSGTWMGYATWQNEFFTVTATPVKPASSLTSTTYTMTYVDPVTDNASDTEVTGSQEVKVIINGTDAYLGYFYNNCWIKGTVDGNKISFPSKQYLGVESLGATTILHEYMLAYTMSADGQKAELADNLVFDYNAEDGEMTTAQTFMVNVGTNRYVPLAGFEHPVLKNSGYVVAAPATPVIVDLKYDASQKIGAVSYINSNLSADGKELNKNNIFYNVYVDGKLLTFTTKDYAYLSANMTDVPYAFYDVDYDQSNGAKGFDFMVYQDMQMVYIYKTFSKIGVKAVYVNGDTRLESPMAERYTTSGINAATDKGRTVKSVGYTDMSGRRVANPAKGIYLQTTLFDNGETETVKVVK